MICEYDGVICRVADDPQLLLEAQQCRHDVYYYRRYIDQIYEGRIIPDEKDVCSDYLVAVDKKGRLLGTVRLAFPESFDLLALWEEKISPSSQSLIQQLLKSSTGEVGSLAVKKKTGTMKISWLLYKGLLLHSIEKSVDYWLIAVDDNVLRVLEMFGWEIHKIGDSMLYMGSPSTLALLEVGKQMQSFSQKNPAFYRFLNL